MRGHILRVDLIIGEDHGFVGGDDGVVVSGQVIFNLRCRVGLLELDDKLACKLINLRLINIQTNGTSGGTCVSPGTTTRVQQPVDVGI